MLAGKFTVTEVKETTGGGGGGKKEEIISERRATESKLQT
jgi:hypothetical protein